MKTTFPECKMCGSELVYYLHEYQKTLQSFEEEKWRYGCGAQVHRTSVWDRGNSAIESAEVGVQAGCGKQYTNYLNEEESDERDYQKEK